MLRDLAILDYTPQIATIPLRKGHQVLEARGPEQFVTFHYSGVVNGHRSRAAELALLLSEVKYQVNHDYSNDGSGAYPDGYLYDFAVLSDGTIVRTRARRQQLWHAGNETANRASWSVHVMLGPGQNLEAAQRASLFALFDALRAESSIPRQNVIAHCEWPRKDGQPLRSSYYRLLSRQTECPGATLFPHVVAYRSLPDLPPLYRAKQALAVYEVPTVDSKRVALHGTAVLPVGSQVRIDATYPNGMAHLVGGLGFVELNKLEIA